MRILKYRSTYVEGGRFETWMFRIARNTRADYFRKRATVHVSDEGIDRPSSAAGPALQLEHDRDLRRLERALAHLREDKRELIVLARYRAMKHEQIAELLDVDVGTVKVRIHRAVQELRDIFLQLRDESRYAV